MAAIAIIIGLTHLLLLSRIQFFPYPELFVYPYLANRGLVPYLHIFDQHFPGLMLIDSNLESMGINSVLGMRAVQLLLVAISQLLIYKIVRQATGKKFSALIALVVFMVFQITFEGYALWIDSFVAPILLASMYFGMKSVAGGEKNSMNYVLFGLSLGVALVFKQVVVPIMVLTWLVLVYKRIGLKNIFLFTLSAVVPGLLMVSWAIAKGIWGDFWFWTVTFNLTTFSEMGRKYITAREVVKLSVLLIPLLVISHRVWVTKKFEKFWLLFVALTFATLVFAYARFDFIHLAPFVALSSVLVGLGFYSSRLFLRIFILSWLSLLSVYLTIFVFKYWGSNVWFFGDKELQLAAVVRSYAGEGDSVFAFGTKPHLYYLTKTMPPGGVFSFQFPWFMIHVEDEVLDGIKSDPPKVILRDSNSVVDGFKLVEYMPEIGKYIDEKYKVVRVQEGIEVLLPK